jgi:hypothetical protein
VINQKAIEALELKGNGGGFGKPTNDYQLIIH